MRKHMKAIDKNSNSLDLYVSVNHMKSSKYILYYDPDFKKVVTPTELNELILRGVRMRIIMDNSGYVNVFEPTIFNAGKSTPLMKFYSGLDYVDCIGSSGEPE